MDAQRVSEIYSSDGAGTLETQLSTGPEETRTEMTRNKELPYLISIVFRFRVMFQSRLTTNFRETGLRARPEPFRQSFGVGFRVVHQGSRVQASKHPSCVLFPDLDSSGLPSSALWTT